MAAPKKNSIPGLHILFEAYGTVMKEYVAVPDALFRNTKKLSKYLALSYDYIATLKPKTTKKGHKSPKKGHR